MSKNYLQISIVVLFQLFLVSCKNTQEKMQDYANSYNSSASLIRNEIISSTSAEAAIATKEIKIIFQTTLQQSENNKIIYKTTLPSLFSSILEKDPSSMELLDEGVHFQVSFLAENESELASLMVDKKKMDELLKESKNHDSIVPSKNSNLTPQMQEILALLNRNMPIVNKEEGTKILKIDVTENNELIYKVEVEDDFAKLLKMDSANELIKDGIIRNGDFRKILSAVRQFGITTIKYQYQNKKGDVLNNITLNQNDLK